MDRTDNDSYTDSYTDSDAGTEAGTGTGAENRIVVGVDGSELSREALRWAVEQARLTGARVDAVMSWEWPGYVAWAGMMPPTAPTEESIEEATQRTLLAALDETVGTEPPVRIRALTQPGSPARVLLEAAEGASLLVVGSRGLGGFRGVLLGSVSQQVTHHAPCTVVVVRASEQKADSAPSGG